VNGNGLVQIPIVSFDVNVVGPSGSTGWLAIS
jgi:hypothetical protein